MIYKLAKNDLAYLDIPAIQAIIDFKWINYSKRCYLIEFIIIMGFALFLILDIVYAQDFWMELTFRIICMIISILCLIQEAF